MSGVGRFKLTDALPKNLPQSFTEERGAGRPGEQGKPGGRSKKAAASRAKKSHELTAEQEREARESGEAVNREASHRGRLIDIGRANQQAGRHKGK